MGSKNVGKPVKDPYTGEMKNHHLGNSDVTLQVSCQPLTSNERTLINHHVTLAMWSPLKRGH